MPRIIVLAECAHHGSGSQVVLEERVVVAHFESDHTSAQILERLGWAIVDAHELEEANQTAPTGLGPGSQRSADADELTPRQAA